MFGYKSFLRIGTLEDASIKGLLSGGLELENCQYSFSQPMDSKGKAQGEVRGGSICMTFSNLPPDEIIDWMLNPRKYKDGTIVICGMNDEPLEKIVFTKAACTGLNLSYTRRGKSYAGTKITIHAQKLVVGSAMLENEWKNI
ncbi:type VI secretion system tube protein TssD [Porphyromonas loveana]|uniref:Type VI secretion system needle protein Hcp n=1 Tax=Porphyromonas loveana TaxID=1884669 RepID=A0A2U1FMF0_9PORP|nr:type VI secretion system tube protein TssD [Porphyromonas loveana]PVZ13329.1 hypothetical protein C7382_10322 [Porphyromonas loveana]